MLQTWLSMKRTPHIACNYINGEKMDQVPQSTYDPTMLQFVVYDRYLSSYDEISKLYYDFTSHGKSENVQFSFGSSSLSEILTINIILNILSYMQLCYKWG